jgi:hypothetical protein
MYISSHCMLYNYSIRSTNTNRTIGTARCIVAGMFGAESLRKLKGIYLNLHALKLH